MIRHTLEYKVRKVKQQERVGRIKDIEKVLHTVSFLLVETQHKRQCKYHETLYGHPSVKHLGAELVEAEQGIHRTE